MATANKTATAKKSATAKNNAAGNPTTVTASMRKRGVKYGLASYVDIHGVTKCKIVPIEHWDQMFRGSELFTGAALDGVPQAVNEDEVAAHPDPASAAVCPWRPDTCWFASDLHFSGKPFEACSRAILKRQMEAAKAMGFELQSGIECEFFMLKDGPDGKPIPISPLDRQPRPAYDVGESLSNLHWLDELVQAMNGLDWDVYSFDHEDANGQFEIDFTYANAVTMADRFTFFRLMTKEIGRKHGYWPTFMPKPWAERTGSGGHLNLSLADARTGKNLFADAKDKRGCGLSKLGYQFIAGVLKHAPAICAVIAPTVNSYKRLVRRGAMSGFTWAPIYQCYGNNNRTNMLRIPLGGGRVECRAADISANPYLAMAIMLAAGLEGIREGLDPGEPNRENMYLVDQAELDRRGIRLLPQTLNDAITAFAADPIGETAFGPLMAKTYATFKAQEWQDYHNHISDWEWNRYARLW